MNWLQILTLFFIFLFTGCTTLQPALPPAQNKMISKETRNRTLSTIQNWNLAGLIAIRQKNQGGSANLQWSQMGKNYHIRAFGPLGTHSFELSGYPGFAELATANGKRLSAPSPEVILQHETGWALPVSEMYYWIRGLPAPDKPAETHFDRYHHLAELNQAGWSIHYLNYTSVKGIDVPSKIFMYYPELAVKIVISQWNI